jgi:hypothetical protein
MVKKTGGTVSSAPKVLGVKDTDFILKLIYRADFKGTELEQAHITLTKVADLHKRNLDNG